MQRTQVTQLRLEFKGSVLSVVDYYEVYRWCHAVKEVPKGIV